MPIARTVSRFLLGLGLLGGGTLVLVGGLAVGGSGLVATGIAGGVAAALTVGVLRESPHGGRATAANAAWQAAGWTVGTILGLAGTTVIAGGVVTMLVVAAGLLAGLTVTALRSRRRGTGQVAASAAEGRGGRRWGDWPDALRPVAGERDLPPVALLPTPALGREWLRTTALLAGRLDPGVRQSIVRRRQDALDELEWRDPAGFARWLAAGPAPESDPAGFVRGGVAGDQAAGTDAA